MRITPKMKTKEGVASGACFKSPSTEEFGINLSYRVCVYR